MRRRDELAWRAAHRINERTKTMNLIVRAKYGCRGHTIYRDADKPNDVTIVMDYESRERADEFMRDPSLAAAMERGGVISEPRATWVEKAESTSYTERLAA